MRFLVFLWMWTLGSAAVAGKGKAPTVGKASPTPRPRAPTPKKNEAQVLAKAHMSAFGPAPKGAAPVIAAPAPSDYDYDYNPQGGNVVVGDVARCVCLREWGPVCGTLTTKGMPPTRFSFPNKCEANCHTKNITAGVCPGDSEAFQKCYFENCDPNDVNPVCIYQTDFPNPCTANCQLAVLGEPPMPLSEMMSGPCQTACENRTICPRDRVCWPRPGKCWQEPCSTYKCLDPTCANPNKCGANKFAFVCANGITFTNKCWANCEGYFDTRDGVCPPGARDPFFPKVIPHDPVASGFPDPFGKPAAPEPKPAAITALRCLAGLFLNKNTCVPCAAGTFSQAGATTCTPCGPGTYAAQQASVRCTSCPRGSFSNKNASAACALCAAPLSTMKEGSTKCDRVLGLYGQSSACDQDTACECAEFPECGWSSTFNKCMKEKDTDCRECSSMSVCMESFNVTDPSRAPSAIRHLVASEVQADVIKVQWVAPLRNFVCNTDLYQLNLRQGGGPWQLVEWPSFGIFGVDPVVSVGGLFPNTEYLVQVYAVSLAGGKGPSVELPVKTLPRR